MKVICVKWGAKYSADYVNKLFNMVERNAPAPFDMYCLTDDPSGIDKRVNIVPLPEDNELEVWWNKMYMFQQFHDDDVKLFLDLDVVILSELKFFFKYIPKTPTFISAAWKDRRVLDVHDTRINSSVVMWTDARYLWDHFIADYDKYLSIYKGIDRFIWNEGLPHNTFPTGIVYSYWKGVDSYDTIPEKYRGEFAICIVNHKPKPHEITSSWIHDYWK
jgi:hypothetical protein